MDSAKLRSSALNSRAVPCQFSCFDPITARTSGEHIVEHGYGTISIATDTGTEILAAVNDRSDIRITNTDEEYG